MTEYVEADACYVAVKICNNHLYIYYPFFTHPETAAKFTEVQL